MKLHDRWILGVEYMHIDLAGETHYPPVASALTRRIEADADIVRLRLSYKFGRGGDGYTDRPLK